MWEDFIHRWQNTNQPHDSQKKNLILDLEWKTNTYNGLSPLFLPFFFSLPFISFFANHMSQKHPTFCSLNPINLWVNAMNWRRRSGPYTSHLEWQIDSHSRRINATKHNRVEIIPKHLLGMRIYPAKPMRINQSLFCESILGSFLWVNFVI